ncbi:hypothetical protein PHLGIDRAFT_122470 [Phlebiopsis gigantea 11061_1 CR5-6]|uniref:Uncharacterized protein n=1 Tax=Phlebiopsis gigantea (strain 11061_1 CR5-6) TaxID=745531 RepID=A0A0C3S3I7_PHLG1|nr:hypothetical protein PHLGIDRAFT_122470 [Phlebiopsis gigantea 11061_1 CR5-6]
MSDGPRSLAFNLILGLVFELMLYGVFCVTFIMSMYFLMQKQSTRRTPVNKLIAFSGILLFCLITAQTVIMTVSLFTPFAAKYADQDPSVVMTNANESYLPMIVALLALYFTELFISSFLMIYRVWIVFQRNWAVVGVPLLTLAASIICEGLFIRQNDQRFEQDFGGAQWFTIGLACDVFVNIYCTGLLAYKIWRSQQYMRNTTTYLRSFSSTSVVAILIESASLYSITTFALLITYATGAYGSYTVRQLHCAVPGIAYCLVIIRFGMGGAFKSSPQLSTFTIPSSAHSGSRRGNDIAMQPVAVNVHLEQKIHTSEADIGVSSFVGIESKDCGPEMA